MTSTDEAVLHEVIGRFGGEFLIRSAGGVRDNYPVDHTPSSFFVDSEGNWTRTYEYGTEPNIIVADIQQILAS
jgi:cytochrome oxidase Cu insertion factor (SCO1/SenC/PrrC family)